MQQVCVAPLCSAMLVMTLASLGSKRGDWILQLGIDSHKPHYQSTATYFQPVVHNWLNLGTFCYCFFTQICF